MRKSSLAAVVFVLALALLSFALVTRQDNRPSVQVLESAGPWNWYRGNLHTHSHWSDGDDYLEMIALWYREHGYQFLVFTDHNVLANTERWINVEKSKGGRAAFEKVKTQFPELVSERTNESGELEVRLRTYQQVADQFNETGKFLLVQGEEISDAFESLPIHLCVNNLLEAIPPMKGGSVLETIQNNVRAVHAQRERTGRPMMVHLNHPNYGYAVTAEELMLVRGEKFFEVYNGHNHVHNKGDTLHASTERIWDILLTHRIAELDLPIMYGLAVDDSHAYHDFKGQHSNPGRGWVMVLAQQLTAPALIEALEAGRFYASSGVTLRRIESSTRQLTVEVEPAAGETYTIDFLGTRTGYDSSSQPVLDEEGKEIRATRRYSDDIGATLKTVQGNRATYECQGDEIYVRARVTSSAAHPNPSQPGDLKQAWCQPVVIQKKPAD